MRINANVMAVNTHRQLFSSTTNGAKAMEKLSSGFRINRASDDAAGLAISEKMRSQIRGMKQASRNAQDGISVVQTAEGALDEVHSMLQRMKELAVQSASDSNQSAVDREALQLEVNALATEIDSISTKTQFNKMNLLDGTFKDKNFHVGANADQTIGITIDSMDTFGLGLNGVGDKQEIKTVTAGTKSAYSKTLDAAKVADANGKKFKVKFGADESTAITVNTGDTAETLGAKIKAQIGDKGTIITTGNTVTIRATKNSADAITIVDVDGGIDAFGGGSSVNGTADVEQTKQVGWKAVNVLTREGANEAMSSVQKSIETLASRRAELGAVQNRIEHTIKNLDNSHENLMAAESRVRHVDMAMEIIESTRNNILQQAATSMLAQANQAPQTVLSLLR